MHHKTARPHSHVQRKSALFWGPKRFFYHLKYNNVAIHNYQIYDVNDIKKLTGE